MQLSLFFVSGSVLSVGLDLAGLTPVQGVGHVPSGAALTETAYDRLCQTVWFIRLVLKSTVSYYW